MRNAIYSGLRLTADAFWRATRAVDRRFEQNSFQPKWAPAPLLKQKERTFPQFGFPRETDSLCPKCVTEVRTRILSGEADWKVLVDGNPGEIKARIVEEDGKILMKKDCPEHGHFEDVMSTDPAFFKRLESLYPGRDFVIPKDGLHEHGTSSIKYGRGAVLTIDLTNRCNMMCNPCFMDANQVGYVHELEWEDIQKLLDDAVSIKPRRQLSVQFSGGEPTISPYFLQAVRYAREVGYFSVQAATNGIRFAQEVDFAREAAEAGLRFVYLQFDGVDNAANEHRKVGNLFDVKQRAIENLHKAGVDITLVTTIVNTVNDHQVGEILKFAIQNIDKINTVSFQPVSFTGRDEEIDDDTRKKQRYTLSHLAHDAKSQAGIGEPMRDWYPLSASGPFSDLKDLLGGLESEWGSLKCGCHPNCGIGTMLLVDSKTKESVPVPAMLNVDRMLSDIKGITDSARKKNWTAFQTALSILRNLKPSGIPKSLSPWKVVQIMDGHTGGKLGFSKKKRYDWRVFFIGGMWFQDLFNYDFRRTEMCIIPYATQMGEISFCAYNTGVGWRKIIEEMFQTASLAEWYKKNGRHEVYARGRSVPLPTLPGQTVPSPLGLPSPPAPPSLPGSLPVYGGAVGK
ncbi:MAG: radical SAM protein [Acidobacteria bacterium]|nr:radical SAM protein [Acidobacteriota bacterium]MCA1611500.1 radical SAM protein [Acidobacteriota bacterium]